MKRVELPGETFRGAIHRPVFSVGGQLQPDRRRSPGQSVWAAYKLRLRRVNGRHVAPNLFKLSSVETFTKYCLLRLKSFRLNFRCFLIMTFLQVPSSRGVRKIR